MSVQSIFMKGGIIFFLLIIHTSAVPVVYFSPDLIEPGLDGTGNTELMIDNLDAGMAGYSVYLTIADPAIATITGVTYPDWAKLSSTKRVNDGTTLVQASDVYGKVNERSAHLATITIQAKSAGSTPITLRTVAFDSKKAGRYSDLKLSPGTIRTEL